MSNNSITKWQWVSPVTHEPVEEEWHLILDDLEDRYPRTYEFPEDFHKYLLYDELAWGYSDPMFEAAQAAGVIGANNNNSPPFRVELGGRLRTRHVYVQVEFSYRNFDGEGSTDTHTYPQTLFNGTKRKIESLLTANPKRLQHKGLSWIHPAPSVIQDGRMFTNFGMVGTLQPAFLETLQDNYKWRYILLLTVEVIEELI